jgi:hypothetical protein
VHQVLHRGGARSARGAEGTDHRIHAFLDDGGGHRLLRVEVVIQGALGQLGALNDVGESASGVTDLVYQLNG